MEAIAQGAHMSAPDLVAVLMPAEVWARVQALAARRGEAPGATVGAALGALERATLATGPGVPHHDRGR
jgi:hypothetical protein